MAENGWRKETNNMADYESRFEDNVGGKFYVDDACIICALCSEMLPTVFKESEEGGYNIVFNQPESEAEIKIALEAMEACPVEAIGDDALQLKAQ